MQRGGGQQLRYEIVESRPLPPNTGKIILGRKTSTSAGYVRIAVGKRRLTETRNSDDNLRIFDESRNAVHTIQFVTRRYSRDQGRTEIEAYVSSPDIFSKNGNYYSIKTTPIPN